MEHHGEGLPDGLSWGPVPSPEPLDPRWAFVPGPRGTEPDLPSLWLPGAQGAARLLSKDSTGVPHTQDAARSPQGPRAPPVWRRNMGRGVLWGSGQRPWGGRGQVASARTAPRPGDSGAPGAWGCQGPLASASHLWRGQSPLSSAHKAAPDTQSLLRGRGRPCKGQLQVTSYWPYMPWRRRPDPGPCLGAARSVCMDAEHRPAICCRGDGKPCSGHLAFSGSRPACHVHGP